MRKSRYTDEQIIGFIRQDDAGYFVLEDATKIVNRRGEIVRGTLRQGTRVEVYFASVDGSKEIDHVVVY